MTQLRHNENALVTIPCGAPSIEGTWCHSGAIFPKLGFGLLKAIIRPPNSSCGLRHLIIIIRDGVKHFASVLALIDFG